MPSFEKYLFRYFAYFVTGLFGFVLEDTQFRDTDNGHLNFSIGTAEICMSLYGRTNEVEINSARGS